MTLTTKDLGAISQLMDIKFKKELKPIKRDLKSIKKDLNWVMGKYDTRLCTLESHTTHPPKPTNFSFAA